MRPLIAVIMFLILASFVAAETEIYSSDHYSGDVFTVENDDESYIMSLTYFIYERNLDAMEIHDDEGSKECPDEDDVIDAESDLKNRLRVKKDNQGFVLKIGECEDFPGLKFCFESIDWCSKIKYASGQEYPAIKFTVIKDGPDLDVKRELYNKLEEVKSELNLEEEGKVEISIENEGDKRASNVIYKEYPPTVNLDVYSENVLSRTFEGRDLVLKWEGFIEEGTTQKMRYRIKPYDYLEYKIPATLSYTYLGKTIEESISDLNVKIITPYEFNVDGDVSEAIQQVVPYTITIENTDTFDELDAKVTLQFSKDVDIIQKPINLNIVGDTFVWEKTLNPGDDRTLDFELRGTTTGEYVNKIHGEFKIREEEYFETKEFKLTLETGGVTPILRFFPETVEGGNAVTVRALVENDQEDQLFQNVKGKITGPLLYEDVDVFLEDVAYETTPTVFDEEFVTPITNQNLEYVFTFEGSYQLSSGEIVPFETSKTMTIVPSGGENFQITQDFSDGLVYKGDEITIKTIVKNLKESEAFKIEVEDTVPEGLELVAGNKFNIIDLDGLESKQVYFYKLKVPEVYNPEEVEIKTTLKYQEYTAEAVKKFTVLDKVEVEETTEETENTESPDEVTEEEAESEESNTNTAKEDKSFWDKVKSFFSKLF